MSVTNCNLLCHTDRMSKEEFIKEVLPLRAKLENYAFTFLRSREEVEDVVQEVYMKLWSIKDRLIEYKSIDALSFTMTKNLSINHLNYRKRYVDSDEKNRLKIDNEQPDDILIEKDNLEKTFSIIERLPSLQQAVLRMKHVEGLEIAEIAEIIGSNEGAVRTNLSRARNRVRTLFIKIDR